MAALCWCLSLLASHASHRPRAPRVAVRAKLASTIASSPPLGQDPAELFELYAPPADATAALPAGVAPVALGATKRRGDVHRDGDWHRSVHVWLADGDGRLLLQQRSVHKDTFPGRWDVSAAGHISAGMSSLECACAELSEELGLALPPAEVAAGWCATVPSTISGATQIARFLCNEYQDLYVLRAPAGLTLSSAASLGAGLRLGADEVAGVRAAPAAELLASWAAGSDELVPRPPHYCVELRRALARLGLPH